jgi:hypothetical protein
VRAFLGGEDAQAMAESPADQPYREAFQPYLDKLQQHQGVEALLMLEATDSGGTPVHDDVYVRYGYYYGLEHMDELKPVIDALEAIRQQDGEYPHTLGSNVAGTRIKTKGGYFFQSDGFGYLPQFKTDSSGAIQMGSGSGIEKYNPEACTGYTLVMYLETDDAGLDLHSPEDVAYYTEKIAPCPYQAPRGLTNVVLHPDGKPDGIACVVRSGELQR